VVTLFDLLFYSKHVLILRGGSGKEEDKKNMKEGEKREEEWVEMGSEETGQEMRREGKGGKRMRGKRKGRMRDENEEVKKTVKRQRKV